MVKLIDETGNRYGRLVVLSRAERKYERPKGLAHWWCQCDCGNKLVVSGVSLRIGNTKSCGCYRRDYTRESRSLPRGVAAFNSMLRRIQREAKARGHEWSLTDERVSHLTKQPCHYCGVEPSQVCRDAGLNGVYIYNGLDRVDNTKGYTIDNVVSCCGICNGAKSSMTLEEFEVWITRLCKHYGGRGHAN